MRVLLTDIETAPMTAYVWGLFKENIPLARLIDTSRILCYSYKWYGQDRTTWARGENLESIHKRMTEADVIVHYNGARFDIPILNREFLKAGMHPPAPYKQIDLYKVVKQNFRFGSNKMEHVLIELGLTPKKPTDFKMWVDCMNDVPEAWDKMQEYNMGDVDSLEELYDTLKPWIKNHPNRGLYGEPDGRDNNICPNCASHHVHRRGVAYTNALKYQRFNCQDCGNWFRDKKPLEARAAYANI